MIVVELLAVVLGVAALGYLLLAVVLGVAALGYLLLALLAPERF